MQEEVQKDYMLNHVRTRKLRRSEDKFLVTTDHGTWALLDKDQFSALISGQDLEKDPFLFNMLRRRGMILNKENIQEISNTMRLKYSHLFQGPSLHIVVPTQRCNNSCIYCHSSPKHSNSPGFDMDEETAKKTVDFAFQSQSPCLAFEFQGGEPLLNFEIIQTVIEYANKTNKGRKKDIKFNLVTNLTLMDHSILRYLIKNNVGICTSLDGPAEVHNKNRSYLGGRGTHKDVVHWINEIKNNHDYHVDALMVTTKHSLKHHKEIIDEYIKNNLLAIKLRPLSMLGHARNNMEKIGYSAEEYINFWKKSMDYIIQANLKGKRLFERMTSYIIDKIEGRPVFDTDFQTPCGAVIGQLAYSYNGDIYTCDEGRGFDMFRLGNVASSSFKDIINSGSACSMIAASTNDALFCDTCAYKPFCSVCPVCNFSEFGTLIAKIPESFRCKVHMAMFDYVFYNYINSQKHQAVFKKWQDFRIKRQ